jgi:polyphosphate kinase
MTTTKSRKFLYRPMEISWLAFNRRVLQEAEDPRVPLIERFKFLGIYSNNLDEFFRVRVAGLKRLSEMKTDRTGVEFEEEPKKTLRKLNDVILKQRVDYEKVQEVLVNELAENNILFVDENNLSPKQLEFAQRYFLQKVRPRLMPVMLDHTGHFPALEDDALYMVVFLRSADPRANQYAITRIPTDTLPRFLVLPDHRGKKCIMFLDDVIRLGLDSLFYPFDFATVQGYTIKLTKDADMDIDDDLSESYLKKISRGLKKREEGQPVRFVYDSNLPVFFMDILKKGFNLRNNDALIPGSRYHNLKDFMNLPNLGPDSLVYEPMPGLNHPRIRAFSRMFPIIAEKDLLLHFPYHSFNHFIDLLREASIDTKVKSIKITLYRLADNSNVVNALINAMRNGKKVTAVVELQARFSEQANLEYSELLREEGARVIYGVPGLKVHSKLCLITRREKGRDVGYACVGTGNFNEESSRVFSDVILMTAHPGIVKEVEQVFGFINANYDIGKYKHLLLSPFKMRQTTTQLIRKEARYAKEGHRAYIHMKLNNLVDPGIIHELHEASRAGVEVKLNVRGMFCMVTGTGKSDTRNIESMAIIDRFLEHTRIFFFGNKGDEICYISSADLMRRNLDRRLEVTCPILDPDLKQELRDFFDMQWKDNVKARILDGALTNPYREDPENQPFRAQSAFYCYLKGKQEEIKD